MRTPLTGTPANLIGTLPPTPSEMLEMLVRTARPVLETFTGSEGRAPMKGLTEGPRSLRYRSRGGRARNRAIHTGCVGISPRL